MKAINNFITERLKLNKDTQAKDTNWELTQTERNTIREILGYMAGYRSPLNSHDKKLKTFYVRTREKQHNLMHNMFTIFNNEYKIPEITNYELKNDEIDLLRKIIIYLKDNDLMGDYETDLLSILNKI